MRSISVQMDCYPNMTTIGTVCIHVFCILYNSVYTYLLRQGICNFVGNLDTLHFSFGSLSPPLCIVVSVQMSVMLLSSVKFKD